MTCVKFRPWAADTGAMLRAGLVSLAAAAALALAGGASAARTPTPAQYRAQATAICTTFASRIKALGDPLRATKRKETQLALEAYALQTQQYAALRALKTPASLKEARNALWYTYWVLGVEAKMAALLKNGTPLHSKATGVLAFKNLRNVTGADLAWKAAGIKACAASD